MFPSSCNNCEHFPLTSQAMLNENVNPSLSQPRHHDPLPFLHFLSDDQPFLADDNELFMSHFFSQQQLLGCRSNNVGAEAEVKMSSPVVIKSTRKQPTTKKKKNVVIRGEKQAVPRKRSGKKDRHSKIYTARGPRDRRMRLSLPIARKFFDLQDMLGFDKASKTIEWLYCKSKPAIKELTKSLLPSCTGGAKSLSSTSESEVVSGIKKIEDTGGHRRALAAVPESLVEKLPREEMDRKSRKSIVNPFNRVSRDKARARARVRTIEKMKMRGLEELRKCISVEANPNDFLEQVGSSSPPPLHSTAEKSCSLKVVVAEEEEEEKPVVIPLQTYEMEYSVSIIEKFLGITTSPRSSSIFEYAHNIGESSGSSPPQQKHLVHIEYDSYCALINMDASTTGNLQPQINPGKNFNINPDTPEQESSTIYMSTSVNAHEQSPSSDFNEVLSSNAHEQNPRSIIMTPEPHFLEVEDQVSCNLIVDKYCSFY